VKRHLFRSRVGIGFALVAAMSLPIHRRHHLDEAAYSDPNTIFFITTCIEEFHRPYLYGEIAKAVVDTIYERAAHHGVKAHAFVIMPEHAHLILQASPTCGLYKLMRQIKSLSTKRAKELGVVDAKWQESFDDRRVRDDAHYNDRVAYTLYNPVRRGLVTDWRRYPYRGSNVLSDDELTDIANTHAYSIDVAKP
jgi:putative transposase